MKITRTWIMTPWLAIWLLFSVCVPVWAQAEANGEPPQDADDAVPFDESTEMADAPTDEHEEAYDEIKTLTEVMLLVRKHYVDEKTYSQLMQGALHGMLNGLDEHSDFLGPPEYERMKEDTSGSFGGIGVHIGMRDGVLTIIAPIEDTPGFRAGLMSGDKVIKVDGEATRDMPLSDVVGLIRGEKGTEVTLTILGVDDMEPRDVIVVRDEIAVPSVKGATLLDAHIGYIRITQFAEPTAGLLAEALADLSTNDMAGLVLDLRNNPGGLLRSAIGVSELFLKENELIVSTKGRNGVTRDLEAYAGGSIRYLDMPMVVLVNEGSASASEIVAGALRDHGRAVLIGETTFGKGSVQSIIRLKPDGTAAIRLTTSLYYTPGGSQIHHRGITPDIEVPMTTREWRAALLRRAREDSPQLFNDEPSDEVANAVDEQLQRALDLLRALQVYKASSE